MLVVEIPPRFQGERRYAIETLLGEFLGLPHVIKVVERKDVRITLEGDRELTLADGLFALDEAAWLSPASLPARPLVHWDLTDLPFPVATCESVLPVLYAAPGPLYDEPAPGRMALGLDVFGSAFFMLTRYEELVGTERDRHERFPATASVAFQEGFLDRPIVDEYLEVLWGCLHRLWPGLSRRPRAFKVRLTHDADFPLWHPRGLSQIAKSCLGDLVKRREPGLAVRRLASRWNKDLDVHNTFAYLMDQSERRGLTSAFYFITDRTAGAIDGNYEMTWPWIHGLLREIHGRGHEIGLHPSYETFRDAAQTRAEFEVLKATCEQLGITQREWGGRQHYLRWEAPGTWQNWEDAGLAYDSTVMYADHAGFRAGTCHEHPVYNLERRCALKLRERPLIIMDGTLTTYMELGDDEAVAEVAKLKARCRRVSGDLTVLWHNSSLVFRSERALYERVLEGLTTD